jgi:hypothetical protein
MLPFYALHAKTSTNASLVSQTKVYRKVSGLAAWSENLGWYSSLPLDEVVLLFCESVL